MEYQPLRDAEEPKALVTFYKKDIQYHSYDPVKNRYCFYIHYDESSCPSKICNVQVKAPNVAIQHLSYMGMPVHPFTIKDGQIPLDGFASIWTKTNRSKIVVVDVIFTGPPSSKPYITLEYLKSQNITYLINYREITVARDMVAKDAETYAYTINTRCCPCYPRFLKEASVILPKEVGALCFNIVIDGKIIRTWCNVSSFESGDNNVYKLNCEQLQIPTAKDMHIEAKTTAPCDPIALFNIGGMISQFI